MAKNIKLLEERVLEAAERLRQLASERDRLERKLASLRDRSDSIEQGASVDTDNRQELWRSERAEVITAIRQTIAELQGE